jgi:hypothetical protein
MWIANETAGSFLAGAWLGLQVVSAVVFGVRLDDTALLIVVAVLLLWRLRQVS